MNTEDSVMTKEGKEFSARSNLLSCHQAVHCQQPDRRVVWKVDSKPATKKMHKGETCISPRGTFHTFSREASANCGQQCTFIRTQNEQGFPNIYFTKQQGVRNCSTLPILCFSVNPSRGALFQVLLSRVFCSIPADNGSQILARHPSAFNCCTLLSSWNPSCGP